MGSKSDIEWTEASWNPTRGCVKVSPGCKHCYAETFAERFRGVAGHPYERGFEPRTVVDLLDAPLRWKRPRRIFVNSMSDLFLEAFDFRFIAAVHGVMAAAPQHTFQLLTKRAARMRQFYDWLARESEESRYPPVVLCRTYAANFITIDPAATGPWPLPNLWLGVSAESQEYATWRLAQLVEVPAAVRFVSAEPLLGPIEFGFDNNATANRFGMFTCPKCRGWGHFVTSLDVGGNEIGRPCSHCVSSGCAIDWVIVGGESGRGFRPMAIEWPRSIRDQCREVGVACFIKQLGPAPVQRAGDPIRLRRKGGDMAEWPEDLRVREFPGDTARP